MLSATNRLRMHQSGSRVAPKRCRQREGRGSVVRSGRRSLSDPPGRKAALRGVPKFRSILDFAKRKIDTGAWPSGNRVPSENELSGTFGVSRMTARRALDQLARDGLIVRKRGAGSFIANNAVRSSFVEIRNISDEIAESGRAYSSRVRKQCVVKASREVAAALGLEYGEQVFHTLIVHLADDLQVQLEYRYVRRDAAPGYLQADLTRMTPNQYLQAHCPLTDASQVISAVMPNESQCAQLAIRDREPCLLITRITASYGGLVSYARILAPANRYRLSGQMHFSDKRVSVPLRGGTARA